MTIYPELFVTENNIDYFKTSEKYSIVSFKKFSCITIENVIYYCSGMLWESPNSDNEITYYIYKS